MTDARLLVRYIKDVEGFLEARGLTSAGKKRLARAVDRDMKADEFMARAVWAARNLPMRELRKGSWLNR